MPHNTTRAAAAHSPCRPEDHHRQSPGTREDQGRCETGQCGCGLDSDCSPTQGTMPTHTRWRHHPAPPLLRLKPAAPSRLQRSSVMNGVHATHKVRHGAHVRVLLLDARAEQSDDDDRQACGLEAGIGREGGGAAGASQQGSAQGCHTRTACRCMAGAAAHRVHCMARNRTVAPTHCRQCLLSPVHSPHLLPAPQPLRIRNHLERT